MTTATANKQKEIQRLREQGDQDSANKLLNVMLRDPESSTRAEAAKALGAIHNVDPAVLLSRIMTNENADLRSFAVETLTEIGGASCVDPLIFALRDEIENVRAKAALGLGQIKDPRAVEPLIRCLQDTSCGMQLEAADALGLIGDPRALDYLIAWTERFYADGIRGLTHKEKSLIVQNVIGNLLKKLDHSQFMLLTVFIGKNCKMNSWNNLGDDANPLDGWTSADVENPVGKAVKIEMARRRATVGETQIETETVNGTATEDKSEKLKMATAEAAGSGMPEIEPMTPTPAAPAPTNGKTAEPEVIPDVAMPKPHGVTAKFLDFLEKNQLGAFALIGGAVRDSINNKTPEDFDLILLTKIPDQARQKLQVPLEWNRQFEAEAAKNLDLLAKALGVSLDELLDGRAEFKSKEKVIPVHYVGPYAIEKQEIEYAPGEVRHTIRRRIASHGLVADPAKREIMGLVSTSTIGRLCMDSKGAGVGSFAAGIKHLGDKIVHCDSVSEQVGLRDVFHILKLQYRLEATLSEKGADALFTAAGAVAKNPEIAKGEFSESDFNALVALSSFEKVVELMDLLHLNGTMLDNLSEETLQKYRDTLAHLSEAREAELDKAKSDLEESRTETEVAKLEFEAKNAKFNECAETIEKDKAKLGELAAKRDECAKLLSEAEMVARDVDDAIAKTTKAMREKTAAGEADVNLIREHRKALADKREIEPEVEKYHAELKASEEALAVQRSGSAQTQLDMEKIGEELETTLTLFQESRQRTQEMEAKVKEIEASLELTPEMRREKIRSAPSAKKE